MEKLSGPRDLAFDVFGVSVGRALHIPTGFAACSYHDELLRVDDQPHHAVRPQFQELSRRRDLIARALLATRYPCCAR